MNVWVTSKSVFHYNHVILSSAEDFELRPTQCTVDLCQLVRSLLHNPTADGLFRWSEMGLDPRSRTTDGQDTAWNAKMPRRLFIKVTGEDGGMWWVSFMWMTSVDKLCESMFQSKIQKNNLVFPVILFQNQNGKTEEHKITRHVCYCFKTMAE